MQAHSYGGGMQEFVIDDVDNITDIKEPCLEKFKAPQAAHVPLLKYQNLLDKLQAFIVGDEAISLLIGLRSCGKSTLLQTLATYNQETCYLLQGGPRVDCLKLLADHFNLQNQNLNIDDLLLHLISTGQELQLLIDDAELLTLESFSQIFTAFSRLVNPRVKLILSGDALLLKRLEDLAEKCNTNNIPTFQFEALTLNELTSYLKQSPQFASYNEQRIFNKKVVEKIYELSKGYIGRINRVVCQVTAQTMKSTEFNKPVSAKKSKKKFSVIDLALSLSITALLVLLGLKITAITGESKTPAPAKLAIAPPTKVVLPKSQHPLQAIQPSVTFEEFNGPSYVAPLDAAQIETVQTTFKPAVVPLTPKVSTAPPIAKKSVAVTPQPKPKSAPASHAVNNSAKNFTLQLMAADQKRNLIAWMNGFNQKMPLKIYYINHNGKSWYVLTYGAFRSPTEAKQALAYLPSKMRHEKPWVRCLT